MVGTVGGIVSAKSGGGPANAFLSAIKKRGESFVSPYTDVTISKAQQSAYNLIVATDGYDGAKKALSDLQEQQIKVLEYMHQNNTGMAQAITALGTAAKTQSTPLARFSATAKDLLSNLGVGVLNAAFTGGITFAISKIIEFGAAVASYKKSLSSMYGEYGKELKDYDKSLNDYKTQIVDLQKIRDSESSSIEQVSQARKDLREIQSKIIEMCGNEADAIGIVTTAIEGQADALDRLGKKKYEDQVDDYSNERNKLQNRAIRTVYGLWDRANGRSSYNTAKQEIQASIEEYTAELGPLFEGLGIAEIQDVFKDFDRGALDNNVTGNINDIIPAVEQALEILEGYQVGDNVSREVYDKNERVLNAVLSKARADRDNSIDLYNMMLRYDLLQDDSVYREANRLAKEAQENFDAAKNQKQEDAAVESFGKIIQDIQENGGENKERILGLFKDLYPVLYAEAKNWEFESKLNLVVDKDETKGKVQQALDELQKAFGDRTITKETLDNWDDSTHTSEQNAAYSNLVKTLYTNGSVQAKSGFEALSNAGMLATDELAGLNDYLNVSGISIEKFYDRVDTSTLKTTKNLRSKFKAALDSVKGKYKDTTDAAVAAWKLVERSENSLSAKTKEVSGEDLTQIESSLSKLKNDVFDSKGNLKTTTLRNKDFVAAFGDIPDYIDPAINALEKFKKVVQTTTDQSEIQKAFDDLATSYIWNLDAMDGLTEADAKYVEGALAQGGVVNASEVVASALAKTRAETALNTIETELNKNGMLELSEANQVMSDATLETINGLVAQESAADGTQKMLANLLIQQMLLNGSTIDTQTSREQLNQLAITAGYTKSEIDSLTASMMLQQSMSQMSELKSYGVTGGQMRRYTNVEGEQRSKLIQNKREQQVQVSMKKYADLLSQAKTTGPVPPSGSGGGGGGSNKEPSKTDKEWDWIARKAEIIERENSRLRDAVNSEYVILQDAKQNITDFSTAQENLKEAESKLTNFGVDVESDGFKDFIETLDEVKVVNDEMNQMIDDTPGYVLPTGDTFAKVEAENYGELVEAARKYKLALDDVEKAQSKTLDENGRGKLSIIEDLIESDKQQIELYKQLRESYKSEYEGYKKEVLEAFGEDEGPKWIRDIEEGNITPEKWEQLSTYDSNDQQAKDRYESIDRAYKAKKKEEEADDTLHEKMKQLVEDEQERFQIQLNIVKAKQEEVQSLIDQAEHNLDMKDILGEVVTEQDYRNLINLNDDLISSYREQIDILQEQADQLDEGEGAWYDVQSQIRDCESAIRDAVKQQAEWNDTILRMPVENISRFLGLIQNLGQTLKNWLSVNDAKGIAQTAEQIQTSWTTAYDQIADDELGLMKQLEDYEELLENYDLGQDKFSEVDDEIQSARDSVESLVEEMIELNKQLLTLPIDKISEMTEYLDGTLSGLQQVQSDYETTINTVIDLINHQTEKIQDEYDELQKKIEDQIKPLQDQIDALQDANDKRDRQLQIENALYELEKAREQHTVQVIRNGQVRYEADAEAVRNAQQGYDDAQYNKLLGDLQDQIDELNDQLADAEEATNDQVDALNDILKNRWETIMPDTERNRNEEVASQFFMDMFGVSNWKELVLAGKNANGVYADERIYQGTRAGYEQNSVEMRDTQRQIDINNIITESLTRLVDDFQADKINSEQLSAKVSTLMSFVSDGLITGQERLENTLSLGDYSNLGAALKDANRQRDNQMNIFSDNLAIAQENRDQVNEIIGRWDDFKVWYDETYQQLYEQYKKIDFIGDTVAKWYDSYDDDDDGSAGYWDGPSDLWQEDGHYHAGDGYYDASTGQYYADGLEKGSVGSMSASDKFKAIQALGLKKLDPDEFPAILHLGEGVINPKQQSTMLGNVRQALALGGNGGAVIQMSFGDITLPSVTNGQDFAESLATQFQPAMNQIFQKIFRR